ncbi:MAG: holo-ACP synthase [Candidatus Magnetoovum sp. WYHC-5]|nr:holo-ACP synthase [Candidatus Magnetoovum sp. WYHC-5]
MIRGLGIDIIENQRIGLALKRWGERFLGRIYTEAELQYCFSKKYPVPCLSARFAAKEAAIKAIGGATVSFSDIEILSSNGGQPYLTFKGKALKYIEDIAITKIHISISHEQNYSVAVVILEN